MASSPVIVAKRLDLAPKPSAFPSNSSTTSFHSSIHPASPPLIRLACSPSTSPRSNTSRMRSIPGVRSHSAHRYVATLWLLFFVLLAATSAAQPETPELTRPVNDFANVIDPDSERQLESLIRALQETTGDVVVVATIDSLQ